MCSRFNKHFLMFLYSFVSVMSTVLFIKFILLSSVFVLLSVYMFVMYQFAISAIVSLSQLRSCMLISIFS